MLASGEAPEWIARQMGHSTTEMLFRVYSRFIPNLTRQDGSAFERLMAAQMQSLPHPVVHPENTPSFEGLPKTQRNIQPLVNKSNSAVKEDPSPETVPTEKTLPSEQPLSVNEQFHKTQVNLSPISGQKDNPWLAIAKHAGLIQPVAEHQIQASRLQERNQ
jgi:integrase